MSENSDTQGSSRILFICIFCAIKHPAPNVSMIIYCKKTNEYVVRTLGNKRSNTMMIITTTRK